MNEYKRMTEGLERGWVKPFTPSELESMTMKNRDRILAELWWVHIQTFCGDIKHSNVYCRLTHEEATTPEALWAKVSNYNYTGRKYAEWKSAMIPFTDAHPEECPPDLKWAFQT